MLVEGQRPLSSPFSFLLWRHLRMTSRANKKITTIRAIHRRIVHISSSGMRTGKFARPESPSAAARPPSGAPAGRSSSSLRGAVSSRGLPARIIVVQNGDTARIGHDRPADAPVRPGEQKTAGDRRRRGRREARGARRTAGTARVRLLRAAAVHRVRRPHRVQARAGRPQDDSPGRRPTDGSDAAGAAPLRDESVRDAPGPRRCRTMIRVREPWRSSS